MKSKVVVKVQKRFCEKGVVRRILKMDLMNL